MPKRLCYRQWLVNYGFDPREDPPTDNLLVYQSGRPLSVDDEPMPDQSTTDPQPAESIDTLMVRRAVARLRDDERDIIERYYYMGQSFQQIAELLVCASIIVERRHRLALARLRRILEPWFLRGDTAGLEPACRICRSPHRRAVEVVICSKTNEESYKRVLRIIRTQFGLKLNHPHALIHHRNFHMKGENL